MQHSQRTGGASYGAGCGACSAGQQYEYPGSLTDLNPTGSAYTGRSAAAHEIRVKRKNNGSWELAEILQVNSNRQAVAHWYDLGSKERLERTTWTSDGVKEKVYTYDVTGDDVSDGIGSHSPSLISWWSYDASDRLSKQYVASSDHASESDWTLVRKLEYNDSGDFAMYPKDLLTVTDAQGTEYEVGNRKVIGPLINADDRWEGQTQNQLINWVFEVGLPREGPLVFDVPEDASGLKLVMEGTDEIIDLGF